MALGLHYESVTMKKASERTTLAALAIGLIVAWPLSAARADSVVAARKPVYSQGQVYWLKSDEVRMFECGYFPLSDDGKTVNIILAELILYWPDKA